MPRKTRFKERKKSRCPSRQPTSLEVCEREDIMVQTPRVLSDRAMDTLAAAMYEVAAHPSDYRDIAEKKPVPAEDLI